MTKEHPYEMFVTISRHHFLKFVIFAMSKIQTDIEIT